MKTNEKIVGTNYIAKYILILTLVIVGLLGTTLAYYTWETTSAKRTNVTVGVLADVMVINYDAGSNITGSLYPTDDKEDGLKKEITVSVTEYSPYASFDLYLDLTTLPVYLKHQSFKYAFYGVNADGSLFNITTAGSSTNEETVSGNFTETGVSCTKNNTNHIVLLENVIPQTTQAKYKLYIWIDGTIGDNPDTMMNQTFSFTLHATGENVG